MTIPIDTHDSWDTIIRKISGETAVRADLQPDFQLFLGNSGRLRELLNGCSDAILIVHGWTGRLIEANHSACRLFRDKRSELLNLSLEDLFEGSTARLVRTAVEHYHRYPRELNGLQTSSILRQRDGGRLPVEMNTQILTINGDTFAVVVTHDANEREKTENALRTSEERFRMMAEGVSDGITIIEKGQVVYVNERACQIFGYPRAELSRMDLGQLAAPEDADRVKRQYEQARSSPLSTEMEYWVVRKDGTRCCVHSRYSFVRQDGEITGCYIVTSDITERAERERELQAIATVATALRQAQTRAEMLPVILDQVLTLIKAKGAAVVFPASAGELVVELARGEWENWTGFTLPHSHGISVDVMSSGNHFLKNGPAGPDFPRPHMAADTPSAACIPLIAQDQVTGAMWVGSSVSLTKGDLRTLTAIADVAAGALHRVALLEETQRRLQRLAALHSIDLNITASLDLKVTLDILLNQVISHLAVDAAAIWLYRSRSFCLEYAAGQGFHTRPSPENRLLHSEDLPARAARERRILHYPTLPEGWDETNRAGQIALEGFVSYLASPLVSRGEVVGILELFSKKPLFPDSEWMEFLESLSMQAAIAIDNTEMFERLQQSNTELTLAYDNTLEGWVRTLDLRDKETEGHTKRVTAMTLRLAMAMGINDDSLLQMRRGALLHDIGKIGIPDSILRKAGPLDDEEWEQMKAHPSLAYKLLSPITYLRPALDIPYCHHEHWDGTGYPRGLKGEEIPLPARVFAVVDVWDALSSERSYCDAWPPEKAKAYLREQSGRQFDPHVVTCFLDLLEDDQRPQE